MKFSIVIPARYASTRLAFKLLQDIHGKPLLQHTYERATQAGAEQVLIATDHDEIATIAKQFGAQVVMTNPEHLSGTSRITEVIDQLKMNDDEVVVNVQGDEPLVPPKAIQQVAYLHHQQTEAAISTLYEPLTEITDLFNPAVVKLILDHQNFAIYFSRAPIPWDRDEFKTLPAAQIKQLNTQYHRHIGLYAFRCGFLRQYVRWQPTALEQIEYLEQLRALYYGAKIYAAQTVEHVPPGVDTQADLDWARKCLETKQITH